MSPFKTTSKTGMSPVVTAVPSAGQKSMSSPLSPSNATGLLDVKDRRAFEHDRQRALKPADRASKLSRRRKSVGHGLRDAKYYWSGGLSREGGTRWENYLSKADLEPVYDDDAESDDYDDTRQETGHLMSLHVSLSDLIRPERKRNGISQGFEFIPRLRPVMIIDEDDEESTEEDEVLDWEVIPAPGVKHKQRARHATQKRSSYAAVVRTKT